MQGIVRAAVAWLDVNEDGIAVIASCWRQRGSNWRSPGVEIAGDRERDGAVKHCRVWESPGHRRHGCSLRLAPGKDHPQGWRCHKCSPSNPKPGPEHLDHHLCGRNQGCFGADHRILCMFKLCRLTSLLTSRAVYGRPVSSLQKRQVSQSETAPASKFLLSQNVSLAPTLALVES